MISPFDAFVAGVCVGFVSVFPVAIVLHFIFAWLSRSSIESPKQEYP